MSDVKVINIRTTQEIKDRWNNIKPKDMAPDSFLQQLMNNYHPGGIDQRSADYDPEGVYQVFSERYKKWCKIHPGTKHILAMSDDEFENLRKK